MSSKRKGADRTATFKKAKQDMLSSPFTPVSERGDLQTATVATRGRGRGRGKGSETGRGRGRPRKSAVSTRATSSNHNFDDSSNQTCVDNSSMNTSTTRQNDASLNTDFVDRSMVNCSFRASVHNENSSESVNSFCEASVGNGILSTSTPSFSPLAMATSASANNFSSTCQIEVGTPSFMSHMPPELLQQLSSVIMQFSSGSSPLASSTQSSTQQTSASSASFDGNRNQIRTTEQLADETQAEIDAPCLPTQMEEDNLANQSCENVDNGVDEDFELRQSLQNETPIESASNSSNVNRTVRRRDIRFEQVKANATQHNLATRVFRNQLSSYSVTSAKMKYNLNLNLELRQFPKTRMLSPGEHPRKDSEGRNIEAFELPDLNHIFGIKRYGSVVKLHSWQEERSSRQGSVPNCIQ